MRSALTGGRVPYGQVITLPQLLSDGVTLNPKNKNDVIALFSFGSYETGVALPMDLAGRMSQPPPPPPSPPRRVSECAGKPSRLCAPSTPSSAALSSAASSAAASSPAASSSASNASDHGVSRGGEDRAPTLLQARLIYERGVASGWGRMRSYYYDWRPRDGMSTFAQFVNHLSVQTATSGLARRRPCEAAGASAAS